VQSAQSGQQKVTYATTQLQPGIKTQFFTTSMAQAQKAPGATQIQVHPMPPLSMPPIIHCYGATDLTSDMCKKVCTILRLS